MENASKALIIAGAILLSILIISLGIMVYNNAKSTVGDANLDAETIQTFNSKFTMYAGTGVSASKANSLIEAVNASNATSENKIGLVLTGLTASSGTTVGDYTGTVTAATFNDTAKICTSVGSFPIILSSNNLYNISYDTSSSGIIYKITITK